MSRLGDLIRLERTRRNLTYKQVARMCGVSDKFLQDVESVLRSMGMQQQTEADFTLDDIAATVDLQSAVPTIARAAEKKLTKKEKHEGTESESAEPVTGSIWLDALSGVLKHVPVYNAVMKEVDHRLLPVTDGRIAGAPADKVYYFMAPDNDLRGFRVLKGDILLVVPAQVPVDGSIMLLRTPVGHVLRKVSVLPRFQAMLQRFDATCESEIRNFNELTVVGRCVRLEADL